MLLCLKSKVIYIYTFIVCLLVYLLVSNKRQRDPREGLWMIEFSKICFKQNSIFENFENPRNYFLFYNVYKENMFTIEIEDGQEAP